MLQVSAFCCRLSGEALGLGDLPQRLSPQNSALLPGAFSCSDLVITFPLAAETVLVPFSAVSLAPCHIPDTGVVRDTRWLSELLVEVFQENEAGGGANDGGQAPDGSSVRYAQRQALADHLVMVGLVLSVQFLVSATGRRD